MKVYTSSIIDASAERVWAHVRDFNGMPPWHPFIAESRIEGDLPADKVGCIRNFRTRDGGVIREQLLALSDYDYSCTYSILESPMGVVNYVSTLKLTPVTDGDRTFGPDAGGFPAHLRVNVHRSTIVDAPIDEVWRTLRDFNSHARWHPAVAANAIEGDREPDEVGCVRRFRLRSGEELRERLLSLSDQEHRLTYCILDTPIPLRDYVATIALRPVTDGRRTFWDWRSSFRAPPGREIELSRLVADDIYRAGFEGLRAFLHRGGAERAFTPRGTVRTGRRAAPASADAILIRRHGGPEELVIGRVRVPAPGPGEVRIRQTAVGVNYLDVYVRTGAVPLLAPPGTPGVEAVGEVTDVGDGVSHVLPGDRVAYAALPVGAYATARTLKADDLVVLPDSVDDETAAAILLKGLTAEYLLRRVHRVRAADAVLVHAAAGATGMLLCQWANHLGATVIGTVGSHDKARPARDAGCDHVIVTSHEDFGARARELTGGRGVDVRTTASGATRSRGRSTRSLRADISSASVRPRGRSTPWMSTRSRPGPSPCRARCSFTGPASPRCSGRWPDTCSGRSSAACCVL